MVMIVPPAWLIMVHICASIGDTVVHICTSIGTGVHIRSRDHSWSHSHVMDSKIMSHRFDNMLVSVFFFESTAQILLELFFLGDVALVGLQVRKGLMKLRHKHLVVGFAEVGVVISTELVVTVDHVADRAHHPFDRVHRANSVGITVHHSDRCLANVLNRDVSSCAVLFTLQVRVGVFLEAALDTVLEEVSERACGHRLLSPVCFLVAPLAAQVRAHLRLELLPVEAMQSVESNHVNLIDQVTVVMVAHGAAEDVHLGARGEENCTAQVVFVERVLHVGKTVKELGRTLIVSDVHNLVSVANVRLVDLLLNRVLDCLNHGWHILGAHLGEGPVPEALRILLMVMHHVAKPM